MSSYSNRTGEYINGDSAPRTDKGAFIPGACHGGPLDPRMIERLQDPHWTPLGTAHDRHSTVNFDTLIADVPRPLQKRQCTCGRFYAASGKLTCCPMCADERMLKKKAEWSAHYRRLHPEKLLLTGHCPVCGKEFGYVDRGKNTRLYCCNQCKDRASTLRNPK